MTTADDNQFIKKSFFDHLLRQGFTREHLEVYDGYFDFLLSRIGQAKVMDLEPEVIYRAVLESAGELDGDEVIEAYMQLMEFFMEYWTERWEAMHPDE
jgi:hypothetical protein